MGKKSSKEILRTGRFLTFVEILFVTVIIGLLLAILIPSFRDARQRAKYTRWFAYNQTWNRDGDCVINYNFQDGKRDAFEKIAGSKSAIRVVKTIKNGALSCDWNNGRLSFNASDYDGEVVSPTSSSSSAMLSMGNTKGGALTQGGRWGTYKQALDFSGAGDPNCYYNTVGASNANMVLRCSLYESGMKPVTQDAVIADEASGELRSQYYDAVKKQWIRSSDMSKVDPQRDAADFTALGSFTIIAWVNFGEKPPTATSPQCIFSRACGGLKGQNDPYKPGCAGSQYDIFTDIQSSDKGAFDVECINQSVGYPQTERVKFKDSQWKQVVLRYTSPPPPKTGTNDTVRAIDCFVNGEKLSGTANSFTVGSISIEPNRMARSQGVLAIGGFFWYGYPVAGKYEYTWPFCGRIDEFMVIKRALSDSEIKGEYLMGSE